MTDVHSKTVRSFNMSQIRGKNTKPELLVRKAIFTAGFRYRLNESKLPGKPDIVLPRYRVLIFVNGCFWHGHRLCKYFVLPKTRTLWWKAKIENNRANDKLKQSAVKKMGYKVIVLWECQLKPAKRIRTIYSLIKKLNKIKNEF